MCFGVGVAEADGGARVGRGVAVLEAEGVGPDGVGGEGGVRREEGVGRLPAARREVGVSCRSREESGKATYVQ